ncbi:MAG: tnpA [Bacteroidetes bacterium]|nr:tnpA [Bacteroidota bacterium]
MSQSLTQIYLHIVFSTKHREPLIKDLIKKDLHDYLGGICRQLDCWPIEVGGYNDHVHILCHLSKKIAVVKLLEEVKKSSSKWIKTKGDEYGDFYWQDGYAAFSVGQTELEKVAEYIRNQYEHHKKQSYQEECRKLLKRYQVDYDERYFWE